jgi:hypothetical protein
MNINLFDYLNPNRDNASSEEKFSISEADLQKRFEAFSAALHAKKQELDKIRNSDLLPQSLKVLFGTALPFFGNSLQKVAETFHIEFKTLADVHTHRQKPNALSADFYCRFGKYLSIPFAAVKASLDGSFALFQKPVSGVAMRRFGNQDSASVNIKENALHELLIKGRKGVNSQANSESFQFITEVEKCWTTSR